MKTQRVTCLFLILSLILSLFTTGVFAETAQPHSSSEDYRAWEQGDSRWGSLPIGSSGETVSSIGCTVTSVTKLIIQAGFKDADSFNVGTLVRWLNNNSGFTSDGSLRWDKPSTYVSGFRNSGDLLTYSSYSSSTYNDKIIDWIKAGYHMTIQVDNGGHWIAVDEAKSLATGQVYIMDSLRGRQNADLTLSSRYSKFNRIHAYTGGETSDPGIKPGKPALKDFSRSYSSGETTVFNWDSTANTTHYNLYIDRKKADGSWEISYRVWRYAISGFSAGFEDGIYRVLLQATNSNSPGEDGTGWAYTNADYVTFSVGSHTCDKGEYAFYEAAHPHLDCYTCSICGTVWRDTTSSNELDSCYYCQRPGKPALKNFKTDYLIGETTVFEWDATTKTTHYNLYIDRQKADGSWENNYRVWSYAVSGFSAGFDIGTYRVQLQATNRNFPDEDGTGWAYTNADYITFIVSEKPLTMLVTFDPNGGSVSQTSKTVTSGSSYGTLPTPTKTNHSFDGWYDAASGGSKVTSTTIVTASSDHTLYAHWTHVCANGHNHSYKVTTIPTANATGVLTGTCSRCGGTTTVTLPKLNTTDYTYSIVKAAACTENGTARYTWNNTIYGTFYFDSHVAALGHAWDNGTVTTPPAIGKEGVRTYHCGRCTAVKTEQIPALQEGQPINPGQPCDGGASCPGKHFTDAPGASNWAHAGIDYALTNKLFAGMSDTTFGPNIAMTRAMLVTVLWRYAGEPMEGTNTFTDVANGQWYTQAIAWAAEQGVVTGVGSNKFNPNGMVTREQMATILYRYAQKLGIDTSKRADLSGFPDNARVSSYARDAVSWAVAEGIISGVADKGVNYLQPTGNATRAQVATILMRFIENVLH